MSDSQLAFKPVDFELKKRILIVQSGFLCIVDSEEAFDGFIGAR